MTPLETNRRILTWLCIYPVDENASEQHKILRSLFGIGVFVANLMVFIVSIVFLVKFASTDIEEALFSVIQLAGTGNILYVSIIIFIVRHKIVGLFKSLDKIYEEHASKDSMQFLARANQLSETMCFVYLKYLMGYGLVINLGVAFFTIPLSWWLEGTFISKYSYKPFKAVLPWNQHTLIGYICELTYDAIGTEAYLLAASFVLLFVSTCLHNQAFFEVFLNYLRALNHHDGNRKGKERLCQIIRFHISAKEVHKSVSQLERIVLKMSILSWICVCPFHFSFFMQSSEAFSIIVLVQLSSAMIMLSVSVLQMDLQLKHVSFMVVIVSFAVVFSVSLLFFYCYCGRVATESFEKMSNALYEANWHKLPIQQQKYFILMIANAQRPLYYHGSGVAILDLQTFTKVLRTVYTYYMMFKTLTE